MTSKIHIKVGAMEVEYEGDEEYLKSDLPNLLHTVADLINQGKLPVEIPGENGEGQPSGDGSAPNTNTSYSVETLAAKLNVKSGTDLITAAAAYLTFIEEKQNFSRQELLDTTKQAHGYYNENFRKNFSNNLSRLTKADKLNGLTGDKYSLNVKLKKELEKLIAD